MQLALSEKLEVLSFLKGVDLITRSDFPLKMQQTSNLSKAHETRDSISSSYSQVVLIYLYPL